MGPAGRAPVDVTVPARTVLVDEAPATVVDGAPLRVSDVVAVARGAPVGIGPVARDRMARSRAVVDALVSGDELIYGLNTGLGSTRDTRVGLDELEAYQAAIVHSHDAGIGPPLATEVVRAAMLVRVAGLARGGAGVGPAAAEHYAAMLNAGIHPLVPSVGSVGASDLMHMAAIAAVAIGRGRAEVGGRIVPGAEALAAAGLGPLRMAPKDGLALVSANGVAVGWSALVVERAARALEAADAVAALSMEFIRGNPSVVDPVVASAKPVAGQVASAARIRTLLEGSRLCQPGGPASVQDPLSFRVVPQVHGAVREVVSFAASAVDGELAAMDDNPLVVVDENRIVSNGNFHPMLLALAVDALRPGLVHVGRLSDRRMEAHWATFLSDPALAVQELLGRLAEDRSGPLTRYAAAARMAELRAIAGPATLDLPPLDRGVEDHGTMAPLAVAQTSTALDLLDDILAGELLLVRGLFRVAGGPSGLGSGTREVYEAVGEVLDGLPSDAPMDVVHAAVRGLLPDRLAAIGAQSG